MTGIDIIKALKKRIKELETENTILRNTVDDLQMDKDQLQERILDLEACE